MQPQPQSAGIKIARPGFDIRTCADFELLFNSAWPSLTYAFTSLQAGVFDGFSNWSFTVSHNLGFPPLCMAWVIRNGIRIVDRIFPNFTKQTVSFNYVNPLGTLQSTDTVQFYVVCYNLDISKAANYAYTPSAATKQPYDAKSGIKVVKQNKNINSTDLRDFILHSRAQSPAVLNISVSQTSPIRYTMNAGYTTWVYGFATSDGLTWNNAPLYPQSTPGLFIDNGNTFRLLFTTSPTAQGSLVVLRDPLFAPTTLQESY